MVHSSGAQFEDLVDLFRQAISKDSQSLKRVLADTAVGSEPVVTNKYKVQGASFKKGKAVGAPTEKKKPRGFARFDELPHERVLQQIIEDDPVLLHTPKLYLGGVFLDSIISQRPLPNGLIPDFMYLTCSGNTLKLTLVEIERSSHSVFGNSFSQRSRLKAGAQKALDQVLEWKTYLASVHARKALLALLSPLFEKYPLQVFDDNGDVRDCIVFDVDYLLVVGNEMPLHEQHWQLIDRIYAEHGIILLTYPMMIEQVEGNPRQKNTLKITLRKVEALSLHAPAMLQAKLPALVDVFDPMQAQAFDPHGIKLGGLGHKFVNQDCTQFIVHPLRRLGVFQRARARCEYPGCDERYDPKDNNSLVMRSFYNAHCGKDLALLFTENNTGLLCRTHAEFIAKSPLTSPKTPHGYEACINLAPRYDHAVDQLWNQFELNETLGCTQEISQAMGLVGHPDTHMRRDIETLICLLPSLEHQARNTLLNIINDWLPYVLRSHDIYISNFRGSRYLHAQHETLPDYQQLLRMKQIRLLQDVKGNSWWFPSLFGDTAMRHLYDRYPDHYSFALTALFKMDAENLQRYADKAKTSC
ncbi:DUF4263 domain-containing protein [Pseudomonas gingeri]|uniref:Shedu anti-phage system protein SduA domain-containing protein n=1 Tax=Pseudomonas gingeri TaxID=117681 RepID=UPI0015A07BF8|nr:DUF4263 domain-containing protein [Pseudomonas gingeri]NVZ24624.1 DUF4263 domain-containing protein [Pseudomonas gingeri]